MAVADPERGSVAPILVKLDRERRVVCDYGALELIEQQLGQGIFEEGVIARVVTAESAHDLKIVLWAFLQEDEPGLTLEEVGKLLMVRGRPGRARSAVLEAWLAGWPDDPNEPAEDANSGEAPPADAGEE